MRFVLWIVLIVTEKSSSALFDFGQATFDKNAMKLIQAQKFEMAPLFNYIVLKHGTYQINSVNEWLEKKKNKLENFQLDPDSKNDPDLNNKKTILNNEIFKLENRKKRYENQIQNILMNLEKSEEWKIFLNSKSQPLNKELQTYSEKFSNNQLSEEHNSKKKLTSPDHGSSLLLIDKELKDDSSQKIRTLISIPGEKMTKIDLKLSKMKNKQKEAIEKLEFKKNDDLYEIVQPISQQRKKKEFDNLQDNKNFPISNINPLIELTDNHIEFAKIKAKEFINQLDVDKEMLNAILESEIKTIERGFFGLVTFFSLNEIKKIGEEEKKVERSYAAKLIISKNSNLEREIMISDCLQQFPHVFAQVSIKKSYKFNDGVILIMNRYYPINYFYSNFKNVSEMNLKIYSLILNYFLSLMIMHDFGILHGDIKIENMMGKLHNFFNLGVFIDFGAARPPLQKLVLQATDTFLDPKNFVLRRNKPELFGPSLSLDVFATGLSLIKTFDESISGYTEHYELEGILSSQNANNEQNLKELENKLQKQIDDRLEKFTLKKHLKSDEIIVLLEILKHTLKQESERPSAWQILLLIISHFPEFDNSEVKDLIFWALCCLDKVMGSISNIKKKFNKMSELSSEHQKTLEILKLVDDQRVYDSNDEKIPKENISTIKSKMLDEIDIIYQLNGVILEYCKLFSLENKKFQQMFDNGVEKLKSINFDEKNKKMVSKFFDSYEKARTEKETEEICKSHLIEENTKEFDSMRNLLLKINTVTTIPEIVNKVRV